MMGWNSVTPFNRKLLDLGNLHESLGVTKFNPTDEASWFQIIGGLLIQGGNATAAGAITFPAPFEKQLLGVFVNGGTASAVSLSGFTTSAANYWWAIGV
jgi:hypothetical protein